MSLRNLPIESIFQVSDYLNLEDRSALTGVDTFFYINLRNDGEYWKRLFIGNCLFDDPEVYIVKANGKIDWFSTYKNYHERVYKDVPEKAAKLLFIAIKEDHHDIHKIKRLLKSLKNPARVITEYRDANNMSPLDWVRYLKKPDIQSLFYIECSQDEELYKNDNFDWDEDLDSESSSDESNSETNNVFRVLSKMKYAILADQSELIFSQLHGEYLNAISNWNVKPSICNAINNVEGAFEQNKMDSYLKNHNVTNLDYTLFELSVAFGAKKIFHYLLQLHLQQADHIDEYNVVNLPQLLCLAIGGGDIDILNVLLSYIDAENENIIVDNLAFLHEAACSGSILIFRLLFSEAQEYQIDLDLEDQTENTPLQIAIKHGHLEIVSLLIESKATMYEKDKTGLTMLLINKIQLAIWTKGLAQLNFLLTCCAKFHIQFNLDQRYSILKTAADSGDFKIACLLIKVLKQHDSCLMVNLRIFAANDYAAGNNEIENILKVLNKANLLNEDNDTEKYIAANVTHESQYVSEFHSAVAHNNIDIVNALLEVSKDKLDVKDDQGRTPLHLAIENGHDELFLLLLNNFASVDVQDKQGRTPLHYAAIYHHAYMFSILVNEHNASVNLMDNDYKKPLDYVDDEMKNDILFQIEDLGECSSYWRLS